ncbi:hypothetical protein BDV41DRAFT_574074 [Aspergillus transmontanensis]|uniref:Uncharacterized protein n=1 Tax=Aspergillus transmontanensis TaxID=1034304 RepID=A0A5N6W893_9EURO|nr:hypothetical protein BDV41DRAFT_574074 [Aspergillus transmontanensis]
MAADLISSLVKIGANALAAKLNPVGAVQNVKDLLGGGDKSGADDQTNATSTKSDKTENSAEEKNAEADLALIYSGLVIKPVEAMVELLSGPDGVIWELVTGVKAKNGKKDTTKGKWNLEMIKTMLERTKRTIRSSKVDRTTSNAKTLLGAINDTLKICKDLGAEGKKAINLSKDWEKPKKDSTKVAGWKKSAKKALASTRKLNSKKEVMTGNPMTAIMNTKENAEKEKVQARTDLTKLMVDSHLAKMNSALDVYTKTQDTARKMQESSIQMQNNLANLRREIAELDMEKATLETIRRVLSDCVSFLVDMKANIAKLVAFFQKVKVLIVTANTSHIRMLLNNSKLTMASREQDGLLDNITKRAIFEYSLDSICSFDFFQDISGIYDQVNRQYIIPGFTLVNLLGKSADDSEVEKKKAELARYSSSAQKGILEIIESKVKKIVANIQPRINSIAATLEEAGLPQLPAEEVQAMQEGSREGSQNIKLRIENNNLGLRVLQQSPEVRQQAGALIAKASDIEAQLKEAKDRAQRAADIETGNAVDNSDDDDDDEEEEDAFDLDS